ncbi:MAG: glycosyl hydrolase family 18 protein [Hespellia sp.]|nr:glycosyl hydrolase family 18 protein [Hespellia sp.]
MDERENRKKRPAGQRPSGNRPQAGGRPQSGGRRPRTDREELRARKARLARARKKRQRRLIISIMLVIILVIAVVAGIFIWQRYGASKETADLNKYYGLTAEDDLAIIVNDTMVGAGGKVIDGVPYIEYEALRKNVNSRFYWDANESKLLYTLPNGNVTVSVGSKDYSVIAEQKNVDYVILKTEGSTAYIALDFVKQYTSMDYTVSENPNRAMIVTEEGETTVATMKKNTQVRYQGGVKSPILTEVSKSDQVTVIEDEGNWKKVRTSDGFIGYVKKNTLKKETTETISRDFEEPEYTSIKKDYKINMTWNNVENDTANAQALTDLTGTTGLTTVSPTWFGIADTEGNLTSIADSSYVQFAHTANLEVWAMFRDFHNGLSTQEEVTQVLSYTSKRENLENQVIAAALQAGVDGINLDFELISEECGVHFIQFVRELGVKCRQNGLVFSVDNYVPMPYNSFRDYKEQGIVADYVVIMGYDEHTSASEEPGSVASYNYVKAGIEDMLTMVPAEKVINGVPFYTRLWAVTDSGFSCEDYRMSKQEEVLSNAGITASWDDTAKQNYAEWEADGTTYKMWLEDAASIEEKMKLIKSENIAGVSTWCLGYETSDIWNTILQYVN